MNDKPFEIVPINPKLRAALDRLQDDLLDVEIGRELGLIISALRGCDVEGRVGSMYSLTIKEQSTNYVRTLAFPKLYLHIGSNGAKTLWALETIGLLPEFSEMNIHSSPSGTYSDLSFDKTEALSDRCPNKFNMGHFIGHVADALYSLGVRFPSWTPKHD